MIRNFTIVDVDQGSPEWFAARAGRVTGSVAAHIAATLKSGGEPAGRRDLRTRLALERICGRSLEDDFENADMARGHDLEPMARAAYELQTGAIVQETGFLSHNELMIGASLDGHIGDWAGIVEFKCPRPANHLKYLRAGVAYPIMPPEHRYQLLHNMFVSGAHWADLASYSPEFPEPLRLFVVRLDRAEAELQAYELVLRLFLTEIEKEQAAILALTTKAEPTSSETG